MGRTIGLSKRSPTARNPGTGCVGRKMLHSKHDEITSGRNVALAGPWGFDTRTLSRFGTFEHLDESLTPHCPRHFRPNVCMYLGWVWPSHVNVRTTSRPQFSLPSFAAAVAYLQNGVLARRLVEITRIATAHLAAGVDLHVLFGKGPDGSKFYETTSMFAQAALELREGATAAVFCDAVKATGQHVLHAGTVEAIVNETGESIGLTVDDIEASLAGLVEMSTEPAPNAAPLAAMAPSATIGGGMLISVTSAAGYAAQLVVDPTETVAAVKAQIAASLGGLRMDQQQVIFADDELEAMWPSDTSVANPGNPEVRLAFPSLWGQPLGGGSVYLARIAMACHLVPTQLFN